ncbi:MAG TPA: tetratricopeptide repeat protein [Firmicutes bacterium]|nr:tetratricopeptide repeat protein [Bacillota bacterium]
MPPIACGKERNRLRNIIILLVVVALFGLTVIAGARTEKVAVLFEYGYAWLAAGQYSMALRWFDELTKIEPADPEAHLVKGTIYQILGDEEQALNSWAEAERLGSWEAVCLAGDLLYKQGKLELAAAAYQKVLEQNAGTAKALYGLGLVAEKKGDNAEALGYYQQAVDIAEGNPDYEMPQAFYRLGMLHYRTGDHEQALEALQRAALLSSLDPYIMLALGEVYEASGAIPEALHAYEYALHLQPGLAPAAEGVARMKKAAGTAGSQGDNRTGQADGGSSRAE